MQHEKIDLLAIFLAITAETVQNGLTILFYVLSIVSLIISIKNKLKKND